MGMAPSSRLDTNLSQIVGATAGTKGGGATTVDVPKGVIAGDYLLLYAIGFSGTTLCPTGFTSIATTTDGNPDTATLCSRTASSEPVSYTTGGTSTFQAAILVAVRGLTNVVNGGPVTSVTTGFVSSLDSGTITETYDPKEVFFAFWDDNGGMITLPSDLMKIIIIDPSNQNFGIGVGYQYFVSTPGVKTATINSPSNMASAVLTVK